eukprot:CAMPEP_0202462510 /NCGR_PEP_ID=MMETSP1360-20130828/54261_1 /ASSEMBLY_ACC=CAM_ASM_000848 /TAXON_ID=515479 /ORGANISM="Licmophora paradoxa, Strain CCMP2313" /LENGTH=171 /DNA_ID=CAMNT_0049085015 /DNA_START=245 /DNA_END=760 /DNA_ORIENTATION=-
MKQFKDADEFIQKSKFRMFQTDPWEYYTELWEIRNEPNVLLLNYESLKKDAPELSNYLPAIAKFIGVTCSSEDEEKALCTKVAKLVSFETMKTNENKFDDNFVSRREHERGVIETAKENVTKVGTHGKVKPTMDEKSLAILENLWKEKVTPVTGHETYEEFAKDVAALLEQ